MTAVETNAVRTYLVETHADLVDAVRSCAAASASANTDEAGRSDTSAVRHGVEACLRDAGIWTHLPGVLVGCVERIGGQLRATPIAAPPYVAPTAMGIVLRATLERGRLVVAVDALMIDRVGDGGTGVRIRPRPADTPLTDLVRVEWRS